jgi:hypothetical protein
MRALNIRTLSHAAACGLCAVIWWFVVGPLGEAEFVGGAVTGSLFTMSEWGWLLFVISAVGVFFRRRETVIVALVACLISLPVYLYLAAPSLFRRVFAGEYTVPLSSDSVWNTWPMIGVFVVLLTGWISVVAVKDDGGRRSAHSDGTTK